MRTFLVACALLICSPAFAGIRVVVPNHDIARGSTITESDLAYATTANDTMMGTIVAMSEAVGMQTRRVLRAGEMLRLGDLRRPVLVPKGSTVTMIFEAPGIVLTATGRAMSEGGLGENVTVQNPTSYRQITAIVIAPGQVRAQMGGGRFASVQP